MPAWGYRLIVISPVAKVATIANWITANIGADIVPAAVDWPELNAAGDASAATYQWIGLPLTVDWAKRILVKLCQLAGVATPTAQQWDAATTQQKINWLASVRAAILSGYGVYVTLSDNLGVWDSPDDALAAMGLQRRDAGQ